MSLTQLADAASREQLSVFGHCEALPDDQIGDGTVVLLGPKEPGFWARVTAAPEFQDSKADPLDRWSTRVITGLANAHGGQALFPFGAPSRPFIGWALRSGRAWASPIGLLVHDTAGLMASYRGAVLLPEKQAPSATKQAPCTTCDKPCLSACPVDAFARGAYDVPTCVGYIDDTPENSCISAGCLVRRSCPISQTYQRSRTQSAYHMSIFAKNNRPR